jgi:hypothetical protein
LSQYLCLATWQIGPRAQLPPAYGPRFVRLVERLRNSAEGDFSIALLGAMIDVADFPPASFMALHECQAVFGRGGWLRKLAREIPVTYIPGGSDAFLYNSAALRRELEPIRVIPEQLLLVPERPEKKSKVPQFVLTHGWDADAWNQPPSKPVLRPVIGPLRRPLQFVVDRLTQGAAVPAPMAAAIAAHRIREACATDAETDSGMWGTVHGGVTPYWGRFCINGTSVWCGCPGDIAHALVLNPEDPALSYLLDLL